MSVVDCRSAMEAKQGSDAIRSTAAVILILLAGAAADKCFLTFDEMNCVNATIRDLPNATALPAKDVKFLQSAIPVLERRHLINYPLLTDFVCLDCEISNIEFDAFSGLKNLIRVELYGNNLSVVHPDLFKNCSKVRDFVVSWNPGLILPETKPFLISNSLTSLDLTGNEISNISAIALSSLPRLKTLILAGNHLQHIATEVLIPLKHLRYLDLGKNRFKSISLMVFPTWVTHLRLSWNPWHCDCALFPVIQWSRTRTMEDEVRCFKPSRVKWREFRGQNCSLELVDVIRQRKMISRRNSM